MHPLFLQPRRLLTYFVVWAAMGGLLAVTLTVLSPRPFLNALALAVPLAVFYGIECLAAWWVCRSHPIRSADPTGAVTAQVLAAVQSSAVWVLAAGLWMLALARIFHVDPGRDVMVRDLFMFFALGIPGYLLSAVVHYLYLAIEDAHEAAQRVLESQVSAREAELRALRAQLNPHFLFNSLNSINALVGADPEGARRMCEGLGDFLRRTLQLGSRDAVTLGEELALVDRYLSIEQVRFGERLGVERAIDPAALDCLLPPLILQPLVENAIKHGVADRVEGGTLRLTAQLVADRLNIELRNPVDADAPSRPGAGLGLENVRRRLAVLGARDASLVVTREAESFKVTLTLAARVAYPDEPSATTVPGSLLGPATTAAGAIAGAGRAASSPKSPSLEARGA